ncbi:hypothetical protein CJF32_00009449 [Rutstroemia sp. NJR-2017a WRK4]|nr:hypothetical protein CJF32_00009449 [Rutstroemia sp. NJR-2017a WRK4]
MLQKTGHKARAISNSNVPRSNPLGLDYSPAPPPDKGPALSAHASRNKDLLPAQIGGIVGAYLLSLCIVGIVLLILGRRLRKQVELEAKSLEVELVASTFQGVYAGSTGPTPVSPSNLRNYSWPSPDRKQAIYEFPPPANPDPAAFVFPPRQDIEAAAPYVYPTHNSVYSHQSNPSIDTKVVEADREMLARDLEDIYAHVMEQEEAKAAGVDVRSMPPPKIPNAQPPASAPQSKNGKHKPADININDDSKSTKTHSRASSILSSFTSPRSPKSPRKKGIRGLRISSPIATPNTGVFSHSDEEPLTPRSYVHRAPPPVPKNQGPYTQSQSYEAESPTRSIAETLSTVSPTSPQLPNSSQSGKSPLPALNTRNLNISLRSEKNSASPHSVTQPQPPHSKPNPKPLDLSPISQSSTLHTNPTTRTLPFRQQFQSTPLASPSFSQTKTTILERLPPSHRNGPQTAGLRTPFSGGAVPYSPYQPFTPMMPITPRLITKEDRKRMKRMQGPKTPVVEMVGDEEDVWDSAY